jgi:myo-inositol-1(or 4)-monophosphatase
VIGVIFAPFTGYLYWASEGNGAWLETPQHQQKRRLPLSKPLPLPSLKQVVLGVEWGSDRKASTMAKKAEFFKKLAGDPDAGVEGGQMVSGIRSFGSAALSCCAVAEGALDIWHEIGCWVSTSIGE